MEMFVLQHAHELGDGQEDVKLIGIYSTAQRAEQAIESLRNLPGFRDAQGAFSVDRYEVDADHWVEGYVTVQ
ncbi:MAG TPA: hypothetical protein VM866_12205 [Pyrinomonadaceae bacterium]|jgi:hypothetical protein|nr:hypothetical protein [Pyrinomonadaceae bacterium]